MRARSDIASSSPAEMLRAASTAYDTRDWATAERLCRLVLVDSGDCFEALSLLGIIAAQTLRLEEAATHLARAVAARPEHATAHNNYANVLRDLGRAREAVAEYDRALTLDPRYAEAYSNRGGALEALGESAAALASYDRAIALRPDYASAHYNRGVALHALTRLEEALQSYGRALLLSPGLADAHYNRGIVLHQLRRLQDALASYDQALQLAASARAHNNRGNVLLDLGRLDEALQSYDRALRLDPALPDAHNNRGSALQALKRPEEALQSYARALQLKPDLPWLFGAWLYSKLQLCDWEGIDGAVAELNARIMRGERATQPFVVLAISDAPAVQRRAAEILAQDCARLSGPAPTPPRRSAVRRLRIGYYSGDFRNHAMAQLMAGVFELHDRGRFELVAFSLGTHAPDPMTKRLRVAFDRFLDVSGRSDQEVAQISRELEIDIAVDLMGFTQGSRPGIFAQRAAPVQVSYLGYAGTTGAPYIDYLVADRTVIPQGARQYYSEKLIYLPNSYFPNSYRINERRQPPATGETSPVQPGLPEAGFVYCCFNNVYKLSPVTFEGWMRILRSVPHAVLWLLTDNPAAIRNLRAQAERCGVAGTRLTFAQPLPLAQHLARHRAADLFLDTLPCGAHTTATDALWSGLPVLTRAGESLVSRVAASLLRAIGLPELITHSGPEYEALAIALANDPQRLTGIRTRLDANRLTMPLFDTDLLTRHLEAGYLQIYRRQSTGLGPDDVEVPADLSQAPA
jgi:predicted O-linked N-acetylglucosamine transferase (SPINDLY family)